MRSSRRISFAGWNAAAGQPAELDVDVKALVERLLNILDPIFQASPGQPGGNRLGRTAPPVNDFLKDMLRTQSER